MGKDSDIQSPERKKKRNKSKSPDKRDKTSSKKASDNQKSEKRDRKDKKNQVSPHQYRRYYGEDRPNSDSYWNKYPRKDKNKVGERYYEAGNNDKADDESKNPSKNETESKSEIKPKERKTVDLLTSRTGGAYIPPAKLRLMQENITDKSSAAYQRIAWEALKKSIHGYINKVNTSNIGIIARELLHENIVRGRGLLCKSLIQAQAASPTFTNVYAALLAVINSKFPSIGELLLKRLVLQFKRGFKQNNKTICISAATFVAHLVNQRVSHEILALEILTLLVETPTDDSVEVAISFLKECGQKLTEVSSKGKILVYVLCFTFFIA